MLPNRTSSCFLSDDENAVARLVKACERREPCTKPLVERLLVPYFENPAEERRAIQAVARKISSHSGQKNIRSTSPPNTALKGSRPSKVAKGSATTATSGAPCAAVHNMLSPKSPPGKVAPVAVHHAHIQQAACPAMFKSPKPSDVPMPSKAFLCRLGTADVPMILNIMPAVMPITAAA